ncbi:MAG: hypothetical protein GY820_20980 [Gammaproteobacteria bacterium]|nr:hypothetical protein [Gammaproteobacteria bacterium]
MQLLTKCSMEAMSASQHPPGEGGQGLPPREGARRLRQAPDHQGGIRRQRLEAPLPGRSTTHADGRKAPRNQSALLRPPSPT